MRKFVIKTAILGILMIIILSMGNCVLAKDFESIKLTTEDVELEEGETTLILYTVSPVGSDNIVARTWLSYNSEIAEVDENGTVTANQVGATVVELVIRAQKESGEEYSHTAKCLVTVKEKQEDTIDLAKTSTRTDEVVPIEFTTTTESEQGQELQNQEETGFSTAAKLIALVIIIGLIVIFILIGTASDKKNGNLKQTKSKTTTKKQKKEGEKKNEKE